MYTQSLSHSYSLSPSLAHTSVIQGRGGAAAMEGRWHSAAAMAKWREELAEGSRDNHVLSF